MSNISDVIEQYLIELFNDGDNVNISRNELANFFSCAPSQINYVLTTRFTPARGFVVESRRGGGGYITVLRLSVKDDDYLQELVSMPIYDGVSYVKTLQILQRMLSDGIITQGEMDLLSTVTSDKSLVAPAVAKDGLRAGILKSVATELLKRRDKRHGTEN